MERRREETVLCGVLFLKRSIQAALLMSNVTQDQLLHLSESENHNASLKSLWSERPPGQRTQPQYLTQFSSINVIFPSPSL